MDKVYIIESPDLEQSLEYGIYSSVEKAAAAIKRTYGPPYTVLWEEPRPVEGRDSYVLVGHYESADLPDPGEWYITGYVVDPPPEKP